MLSKNQLKFVESLKLKKYRKVHKCFIIEGEKNVNELLRYKFFTVLQIFATLTWIEKQSEATLNSYKNSIFIVTENELCKISELSTPNKVLCIAQIPDYEIIKQDLTHKISLYLDGLNDPGNVGTIIRIADWFGLNYVFCSPSCADIYGSKTVQASMGSILRVKTLYIEPEKLFTQQFFSWVYAADLKGNTVFKEPFKKGSCVVIGSESHGISAPTRLFVNSFVTIPGVGHAESLNAAVATGIICAIACNGM